MLMAEPPRQGSQGPLAHKEDTMPTCILLSTLTPEGRQTLHRNPDRATLPAMPTVQFRDKLKGPRHMGRS